MTAEHSAGTAVFSSLRQLATSASRSTVRTPPTAASAAALLACGERMESAGSDFGSGAMFMPHFTREPSAVQPRAATLVRPRRQVILFDKVAKSRELPFEVQFDGAGRPVALFGDDDFGLAQGEVHFELPFLMFGGAELRLLVLQIIFLAI